VKRDGFLQSGQKEFKIFGQETNRTVTKQHSIQ
jgi:hypothetical protein